MPDVRMPDGTIVRNVPDGITRTQLMARYGKTQPPADDSATRGVGLGMWKPLDNAARAVSNIPVIGPALDHASEAMGMPTASAAADRHDIARHNNSRTGFQTAGNIVGTLPLARLPGGAATQGALGGAALTDAKDPQGIARDAALGALSSKVVQTGLGAASRIVSPVITAAGRELSKAGIPLTPGQIASMGSGAFNRVVQGVEENFAKLPFVGDVVKTARDRAANAYYKKVVARTGVAVPDSVPMGHETHDFIGKQLSDQYEAVLPKLQVSADAKFNAGLAQIEQKLRNVIPSNVKQFTGILKEAQLQGTNGLALDGRTLQHADRVLRAYSEKFGKSLDPNQQIMGDAFNQIRQQFRALNMRQNPQFAPLLSQINKAWRELAIIRKAAGDANKGDGIFSPARYASAAKGSKTNQQLTRAADQVIPNRSPDSGTTRGVGTGWLLTAGAGGAAGAKLGPMAAIPAAGSLLYTKTGQKMLNKAVFAPRGPTAKAVGKGLDWSSKLAPLLIPSLTVTESGQ
jgi:hypothetical protein